MSISQRQNDILNLLQQHGELSSSAITTLLGESVEQLTIKRDLSELFERGYVLRLGKGRATTYQLNKGANLTHPIDIESYFSKEIHERKVLDRFRHEVISEELGEVDIFTPEELTQLNLAHENFIQRVNSLSPTLYKKEMERLAIDLSWKSSQIEGNTYTLLETELLLKEKVEAEGKPKEDATMLLNHKEALEYVLGDTDHIEPLTVSKVEDIHSLLVKDLGVGRNIRQRAVGITGTNYRPLDNEFQIREALESMCQLINKKSNPFEKALLALLLISYIQPFEDGNKRTARIVSNALLLNAKYCPMSFRSVEPIDYKKAMLLFYEQNNLSAFKQVFIDQYLFAASTYF